MASLMCSQYRDSNANSLVSSMPMWLLQSSSNSLSYNCTVIINCLHFIATTSMIVSTSLNVQQCHVLVYVYSN